MWSYNPILNADVYTPTMQDKTPLEIVQAFVPQGAVKFAGVEIPTPQDLQEMSAHFDETPVDAFGPQEPPQDYRIFNRQQADGTYRDLKEFFFRDTETPLGDEMFGGE